MDYSKALNAGLGIVEEKKVKAASASLPVKVRQEKEIRSADSSNEVQFNAASFSISNELMTGLARFVGSKLEIAKNGAVSFIFGKGNR